MTERLLQQALRLQGNNQLQEASQSYTRILHNEPDNYSALVNFAILLRGQKKYLAAKTCYQRALKIKPDDASVWSNFGNLLCDMLLFSEADIAHDKALALGGDTASNLYNSGVVPFKNNDPGRAISLFSSVLDKQPSHHNARWNRALSYLQAGDYLAGFAEYEIRLDKKEMRRNYGVLKRWQGENLRDKTILLTREQGLGDVIQFVRFAKLLKDMGAEVFLESQTALKRLMFCVDYVDQVVDEGVSGGEFDFYIPLMSLPMALNITLDSLAVSHKYIDTDKLFPAKQLPGNSPIKVGLVWASKPGHPSNRSCSLQHFLPLLENLGVDFFSFQKGEASKHIYELGIEGLIYDLDVYIQDFYDTACYMKQMDLVISIDSSPLHCAAALGVNCWALLLHAAEWRWLLERNDSPWYPSMTLYRQTEHNNWGDIMDRLSSDFKQFLAENNIQK